jgi:hypothetical protein
MQVYSQSLTVYRRHLSCCKLFVWNTDVKHAKAFSSYSHHNNHYYKYDHNCHKNNITSYTIFSLGKIANNIINWRGKKNFWKILLNCQKLTPFTATDGSLPYLQQYRTGDTEAGSYRYNIFLNACLILLSYRRLVLWKVSSPQFLHPLM